MTPEKRDRDIAAAFAAGHSDADIARAYGITPRAVRTIRARLGLRRTREPRATVSLVLRIAPGDLARIRERARAAGLTVSEYVRRRALHDHDGGAE